MRGNIFTLEALFATLLFILVVAGISSYNNSFKENTFTIADEKLADDVLIILEKKGNLSTLNLTLIQNNLDLLLSNKTDYLLELKTYNYTGGTFVNISASYIGSVIPNDSEVIVSDRSFFTTENGSVGNYTIARLYLWND
jgi:hypothetical protein